MAEIGKKSLQFPTVEEQNKKILKRSFIPNIEQGNRKSGLKHIKIEHDHESKVKYSSKFLPGIGEKEITPRVIEFCGKINVWRKEHRFLTGIIDMRKPIGISRDTGRETNFLKIVFNGNTLHTAYPH